MGFISSSLYLGMELDQNLTTNQVVLRQKMLKWCCSLWTLSKIWTFWKATYRIYSFVALWACMLPSTRTLWHRKQIRRFQGQSNCPSTSLQAQYSLACRSALPLLLYRPWRALECGQGQNHSALHEAVHPVPFPRHLVYQATSSVVWGPHG